MRCTVMMPVMCCCDEGLFFRATNDVHNAVKHFNLARRDGQWGAPSLMNMVRRDTATATATQCNTTWRV